MTYWYLLNISLSIQRQQYMHTLGFVGLLSWHSLLQQLRSQKMATSNFDRISWYFRQTHHPSRALFSSRGETLQARVLQPEKKTHAHAQFQGISSDSKIENLRYPLKLLCQPAMFGISLRENDDSPMTFWNPQTHLNTRNGKHTKNELENHHLKTH